MPGREKNNIHENHRQRVRKRFLKSGFDGVHDINILEMLLFYTIPFGDTNVTAHELYDTFGSLSAVLDAPYEELLKVKGVGEYTAVFLKMLPQIAQKYTAGKIPGKFSFSEREKLHDFIKAEFLNESSGEVTKLLCFNSAGNLLNCCNVSIGTKNSVHIDRRTLLETAFRNNAVNVILAHNHPNGLAVPSSKDIDTTREIFCIFSEVKIRLVDHIIAAGNDTFSFAESPKYYTLLI